MTANIPAIKNDLLPSIQEFQMFQTISKSAKASGLYGGDENKVFMILLAARELGIPPMLALNGGIWNIQGKIEISARLMNSMIRRAGHKMSIKSTDKECTITGVRSDTQEEHTETFTWSMAEKAGLTSGNVWKKYPEDMLYNRCMSRLARRLFPDVIGTAYVEGEIKEAVENDKTLPEAEFDDITPSKEVIKNVNMKIEHVNELLELRKQLTPDSLINFEKHFPRHFGTLEYSELPEEAYARLKNAFENNIKMTKEAAQVNENT
jgi:hypothetical protein